MPRTATAKRRPHEIKRQVRRTKRRPSNRQPTRLMTLPIVKYGHPALRKKGERVENVTPEIKQLIIEMFAAMEEHHGVGLAAQQVGVAKQIAVIDVRPVTDRPSTLELNGQPADPAEIMPLALINPQITPVGEPVSGAEGCLSFPEVFAGTGGCQSLGRQWQPHCLPLRRSAGAGRATRNGSFERHFVH
jgi:peptide deformylase